MPELYNVVSIAHESFVNWTLLAEGNKVKPRYETVGGDVVYWRKIKLMVYLRQNRPDPKCFKQGYDDKSFKEIQIQKSVGIPLKNPEDLPKMYTSKLPIILAKYKDLQDPCVAQVIQTQHHRFYEELPCQAKPNKAVKTNVNSLARQKHRVDKNQQQRLRSQYKSNL